jgi:hypothetical protein
LKNRIGFAIGTGHCGTKFIAQIVDRESNVSSVHAGYQECEAFHHFLGRIVPSGEKFEQWNQMSRAGKLAWFWNALC